jgi:hypothetical protein
MPRILVISDDGRRTWIERVTPEDFATAHFRQCLSDRLAWAVADASEPAAEREYEAPEPVPSRPERRELVPA